MRSTSGDAPMNCRLGMVMVLPTFISAIRFQNSAVAPNCTFCLFALSSPFFSPAHALIGFVVFSPEETLHLGCHYYFTALVVDGSIGQRTLPS